MKRWIAAVFVLATILLLVDVGAAEARSAMKLQVRVWQSLDDEEAIYVSARIDGAPWAALGTIPLPLDDGSDGQSRYGVFAVDAPARPEPPASVEVRVWQNLEAGRRIDIEARPEGGTWLMLGRIPLSLDDGFSRSGRYRYGDITATIPLSTLEWYRLDGPAPCRGVHPPGWGFAPENRQQLILAAVCWWVDEHGEINLSRIWELYPGYNLWSDVEISPNATNLTLSFFDESYYVPDVVYLIDGSCIFQSQLEPGGIAGPLRRFATMEACALAAAPEAPR